MKLRKAQITAFGRFQNLSLDFAPGLNVVYGPNEAGKSTLLHFLRGMLFGLQKPGALRRQPLPELDRLQPWNGAAPRGTLTYDTSDGRAYRVERDFSDRGFVRVYDAATGQELTAQYAQDRRKELLFAEQQLGLTDGAFAASACIGQMEATKLGVTQELTTRLANLVGGGQEDVSITGVLRLLDQEMAKIGDPKRDSGKPLAEAGRRVSRLEADLAHGRAVQQENMENERRLTDLRRQTGRLAADAAELSRALSARRYQEAAQRLIKLRQRRQALAEQEAAVAALQTAAGFPAAQRDEVIGLAEAVQGLEREEREARAALDRAREDQLQAVARLDTFGPLQGWSPDTEVQVNADFRQYSGWQQDRQKRLDDLARVQAAQASLDERIAGFGSLATEGAALEARLDELAEQAHQIESEQAHLSQAKPALLHQNEQAVRAASRRQGLAIGVAAALAVVSVVLALVLRQPLLAGIALLAVPLWFVLRPGQAVRQAAAVAAAALVAWEDKAGQATATLTAAETAKTALLAQAGCTTAAEWKARRRACGGLQQERETGRREAANLEAERQHIEQSLDVMGRALAEVVATIQQMAAAVDGLGAGATGLAASSAATAIAPGPRTVGEEHLRQFRRVWAAYRQAREDADEAARQEAQARRRLTRANEDLTGKRRTLADRLAAAGAADLAQYNAAHQRYLSYREAVTNQSTAAAVLQQALAEGDEASLEALLTEMAPAVAAGPGASTLGGPGSAAEAAAQGDAQEMARRLDAAKAELARNQAEVRGLEERLEQAYRDLPDLAGLETVVAEARSEKAALEERRWVLEQAKAAIEAASEEVHREFAPRLNQVASTAIASITAGRYSEVRVDQYLGLRVVVPETGELQPVQSLSGGAVDQFYLALRLGMARLLTAGGEPVPFLLDDTFVQFDDERLARAVAHLTEVAAANQVFLFTCHEREVAAARRCQPEARVLELSAL